MNKNNTALLIIDVVNGCVHKKCEDPEIDVRFSKIRKIVPRLITFIKNYKKIVGGLSIFANLTPWTKQYLPKNIQELYSDPKVAYYSDDETGFSEQFYKIRPTKRDTIITKNTYDAFTNPKLIKMLRQKGIKYLIIVGFFTEGCVLATIVSGFSAGFNFVILKDLIETADNKERQEISKYLKNRVFPFLYGKTITSKEFLSGWRENRPRRKEN